MFCYKCGKEIPDGAYSCPFCGTICPNTAQPIPTEPRPEPKVWFIFAKAGYISGLICFILSFIPFFNFFSMAISPYSIALSALGKKSTARHGMASKGLKFSIAAAIISFTLIIIMYVLYMIFFMYIFEQGIYRF